MDIKVVFLNSNLKEEIYMNQPIYFLLNGQEDKVCRLQRSIYDLRQHSESWYFRFYGVTTLFALSMISGDHYVYIKKTT